MPSPTSNLPIIDIGGLRSSDVAEREKIAGQLRDACQSCGFFYIINHGIDSALLSEVQRQSELFFGLSTAAKREIDKAHSACNRGYEPLRGQTLEAGTPPDLKEGFYIGNHLELDDPRISGRFNQGPNQWPTHMPDFKETMELYFDEAHKLSALLMEGLALSLGLPSSHFAPFIDGGTSTLRLLHYPPQPPQALPNEKGCGAHTDFGAITLLLQDSVGGLQVLAADGKTWIDAPPIPGAYVVNLGDLISRWTNDRYHSNVHRVINVSGRERYSVPYFFTGNLELTVECLPTCLEDGETPKYPPITVGDHLRTRYERSYGGRA